ncbi:hypothetical protein [Epilithonimonas xixisoli]|uniref:HTH luxR-type domain-containing protein n=1 Tax=Epilithonimonas xixisoli TaxID=1476462 RepID=A0A4R8I2Z0_9FLAO|nr:hypothetical protein [Epilithonimonas xixisoli]TDX82553.1 hypothetical protein B0I22_2561 [Epilithonimonas xixisoli]
MKINLLLIFIFILCSNICCSQNTAKQQKTIDSLWTVATDKNAYLSKGSKEMLRLCTEVYYQSKSINYEKGELRALVKMAEIYTNEQNYEEGLSKISEGLILAEKSSNYITWSDLLRLQCANYLELGYYEMANQSIRKALVIADNIVEKDRKHFAKSTAFKKIGDIIKIENISKNKYDSIQFYYYKAYVESKNISASFPRKNMHIAKNAKALASVLFNQNKIPEAEQYIAWYEELTKDVAKNPDYIALYILKGKIENKKENYTKAIEYFNKSLLLGNEYKILPSELTESYSGIAESYKALKDYKNQAIHLDKAEKIEDSLSIIEKRSIENVIKPAKTEINDKENSNLFIIILSLAFLAIVAIFFFIQRKKIVVPVEESIPQISEDIDDRLDLPEKQQESTNPQELSHIIELARNNDPSFNLKFSELFPSFNQNLLKISPQLTLSDLEYCALMKLNFDTKQIATFKKTSITSVESRKYRIRKKLSIGNSENIYTWLMKI